MSKEITKKFVENNGFICNNCGKIIVDGTKHKNEEDLCDQCKISDLEAKLAEKESWYYAQLCENEDLERQLAEHNEYFEAFNCKDFNEFQDFISTFMLTPHEEQTLIRKLKQQLAEKDETIKEINKEFVQAVKDWKSLVEQKNRDIAELEEHDRVYHNQLAIAELEKVQSALYSIPTPYDMITSLPISGNTFSNGFHKGMYKVIELIDNQIKQLKGMK